MGIPAVTLGRGKGGRQHSVEDWVDVEKPAQLMAAHFSGSGWRELNRPPPGEWLDGGATRSAVLGGSRHSGFVVTRVFEAAQRDL